MATGRRTVMRGRHRASVTREGARSVALRRGGLLLLALLAAGRAQPAPAGAPAGAAEREHVVIGSILPQPEKYFLGANVSAPNVVTNEDLARVPGIPVRQHPVNVAVGAAGGGFQPGCAQCHRLAGPLPPGAGAPPDVFDTLGAPPPAGPAPAGFTRLTDGAGREEMPSWSPDGASILYEVRDAAGSYNLWLARADGSSTRQLTHHAAAGWASWNPDGRRIAYWAADAPGGGDLWLLDLTDGSDVRITGHRATAWPQWSPDGRTLAFQASDGEGWSLRLWSAADGGERDLAQAADATPSRPLWSPDGSEILYQSLVGTRYELTRLVFERDAGGTVRLDRAPRRLAITTTYPIDLGAATQRPAWSPAEPRLAFAMFTLDVVPPGVMAFTYKSWTLSPTGALPRLLVPSGTLADRSPSWSPDGAWLAQWSWNDDLRASVWLVEAHGPSAVDVTANLGGDALYPAWSPDGRRLAFASDREGTFDIWIADVAGVTGAAAAR